MAKKRKTEEQHEREMENPVVKCSNCGESVLFNEACHSEKLSDGSLVGYCCEACHAEESKRHREYEARQADRKQEGLIDECIEKLSDAVNSTGWEEKNKRIFFTCFLRKHRTLQAGMIRMLLSFLMEYGELPEDWYDLRNSAAVRACKKLLPRSIVEDTHIPFI